ncbi:MAG: hypothetical protein OXD30_01800 [Bryobacterales bacterium]|nr:hypothetical protein [Bryobacterales bacterium]
MSADTKWIVGTVLTVALALAALIQSGQSENVARFTAIEARLGALEQVQAQHGLLLQLLAQRVLGMDADLSRPAVNEARAAEAEVDDPA